MEDKNDTSIINLMELNPGLEFQTIVNEQKKRLLHSKNKKIDIPIKEDLNKCVTKIQNARNNRKLICYVANVIKARPHSSINPSDNLPFSEMINQIPENEDRIDILLVTGGGSAQEVVKLVDLIRNRFKHVTFILPHIAMSAGTIFALSGDEIIMNKSSQIGPIDPQFPTNDGNRFSPGQGILTVIEKIRIKGEENLNKGKPIDWTDFQILKNIDPKELAAAINGSQYSTNLVEQYLLKYKFNTWTKHSDGSDVTKEEKADRAKEIASLLCNHNHWKDHNYRINRTDAWKICKLKIIHSEDIKKLDQALNITWAYLHFIFENTELDKIHFSQNYTHASTCIS